MPKPRRSSAAVEHPYSDSEPTAHIQHTLLLRARRRVCFMLSTGCVPLQMYALALLEPSRVALAKKAVEQHYNFQRERYGAAFKAVRPRQDAAP